MMTRILNNEMKPGTGILDSEPRDQDPGHKIHDLQ